MKHDTLYIAITITGIANVRTYTLARYKTSRFKNSKSPIFNLTFPYNGYTHKWLTLCAKPFRYSFININVFTASYNSPTEQTTHITPLLISSAGHIRPFTERRHGTEKNTQNVNKPNPPSQRLSAFNLPSDGANHEKCCYSSLRTITPNFCP